MLYILMLDTNTKLLVQICCLYWCWIQMSSHVNSCHGDYPFISHIVSSGVHMCCPVKPWNVMSSHDKPCQVMSWRLSPHFSYCQLRCVLCGNFPLVSHIVSSGVHFNLEKRQNPESEFFGVELESKFILKKVVSMTAHVHTWADNIRNEGKIATKWTPELTIWETRE